MRQFRSQKAVENSLSSPGEAPSLVVNNSKVTFETPAHPITRFRKLFLDKGTLDWFSTQGSDFGLNVVALVDELPAGFLTPQFDWGI